MLPLAAVATLALIFAAAATAKGPSEAKIEGPGISKIELKGDGETPTSALGEFAQSTGFFATMFGQSPDPRLHAKPSHLGPKFTVTYTVPGPENTRDTIHQDLYPYAGGGPVTYMKPGQLFFGREHAVGGWYQSTSSLKTLLVAHGLPARATAIKPASGFPATAVAIAGGVVGGLALLGAVFGRSTIARWRPRRSTSDTKGPNV
jgi:hypothetical protein